MKRKNRTSRPPLAVPHPAAAVLSAIRSPFQAVLSASMRNRPALLLPPGQAIQMRLQPVLKALSRARVWMQARFAQTANRRLRVAETISLGEKRFVALVTVEGREFLIGGGASGVSLLAQLESPPESQDLGLPEGSCQ